MPIFCVNIYLAGRIIVYRKETNKISDKCNKKWFLGYFPQLITESLCGSVL